MQKVSIRDIVPYQLSLSKWLNNSSVIQFRRKAVVSVVMFNTGHLINEQIDTDTCLTLDIFISMNKSTQIQFVITIT